MDSLDGKSDDETAAGKPIHVVGYSTEEGRILAEFISSCADSYDHFPKRILANGLNALPVVGQCLSVITVVSTTRIA